MQNNRNNVEIVRHEYGHYLQLKEMGWGKYINYVAVPSFMFATLVYFDCFPYENYNSLPQEYDANVRANANMGPYLTDADKRREEWMRAVMNKRLPYNEIIDNAVKGRIGG